MVDRTDGWVVGLRLATAFLAGAGGVRSIADFAGDIRGVANYPTDEVLIGRAATATPVPVRDQHL
jgi:LuxR family maltose regulon positive regulatory protein